MRIRQNFLPRNLIDWLCFLLINFFMPIVFVYEMAVVLPEFHEPGSFMYYTTIVLGVILIFEIMGNYVACLVVDTSVDFKNLEVPRLSKAKLEELGWHHCDKCNKLAPPRSWHCEACEVCILKRDHHCIFTGCCVGQENHRYFVMFIIYLLIGSTYAFAYNSLFLFVLHGHIFLRLVTLVKVVCPMLMLLSDRLFDNMCLMFYNLNILAVVYSVIMTFYHAPSLIFGGVCYEKSFGFPYNKGSWRKNFETVLGKNMNLVWLSPIVKSQLPDDGINWVKSADKSADKKPIETVDKPTDKKTK